MEMNSYFLWIDGRQSGPYTMTQLHGMWSSGAINLETPHRRGNANAWSPLGMLVEQSATTAEKPPVSHNFHFFGVVVGTLLILLLGLFVGLLAVQNLLNSQRGEFLLGVAIIFMTGLGYLLVAIRGESLQIAKSHKTALHTIAIVLVMGALALMGVSYTPAAPRKVSNDWALGYNVGVTAGRASANNGGGVPGSDALHTLAEMAEASAGSAEAPLWKSGYESGFEQGWKSARRRP